MKLVCANFFHPSTFVPVRLQFTKHCILARHPALYSLSLIKTTDTLTGLANGPFAGQRGNASAYVSPAGALHVRAGDGAHQAFAFHPPRPAPQNTHPSPGGTPSYTPWYKTESGVCVIVLIVLVVVIVVAVLAIKFVDGVI